MLLGRGVCLLFFSFTQLLVFTLVCSSSTEDEDISKRILVLIENLATKDSHSIFLNNLKSRGYELTIKLADDPSLTLRKFGEYNFRHVLLLVPSVREFGGKVDVKALVQFIDDGGNMLIVGNSDIGEAVRELTSECGVEFDEEKTSVIDHFNYDTEDDGTHSMIVVENSNLIKAPIITGSKITAPFLYRGIGISADSNNPLLIDVLHASPTSYCYNPSKPVADYPNCVGTNTQLITALQARNNARIIFSGSLDFFSDSFFTLLPRNVRTATDYKASGNQELATNLTRWLLGETGVLRCTSVAHHRVGEKTAPQEYTIMDEMVYTITIETKDDQGKWVPYKANDVQFELVRIDPFIRRTMTFKDGKYSVQLKLPDVYGVFKFLVDYHRLGYTHLMSSTQVAVRPFVHTQYERFIDAAYPYYFSAISMIVGLILFSFIFLYYRDDKEKTE